MNYQPGYHPYVEPPTRAEADADAVHDITQRPDPDTQLCIAAWVTHDHYEWLACDFCQGRLPLCRWNNGRERCVHGNHIDDPTTHWHPIARRHYCEFRPTGKRTV